MDTITTQTVIDELMNAFPEHNGNSRQRYVLEQTLHNLVRLAKVEQVMEMKASIRVLTQPVVTQKTKASNKAMHRH